MTLTDAELALLDPDHQDMSLPALVLRRVSGRFAVDEWGHDRDMVAALSPIVHLRWSVEVHGAERLPEIGPAVIVHNRRLGLGEPLLTSSALGRAIGRPVRFAGVPDVVGLGSLLRRVGGVPSNSDDLRVLLRAGEIVAFPLGREVMHPFHAGPAPVEPLGVALSVGAPIVPVAISGFEPGRHRRVVVGDPVTTRRRMHVVSAEELAIAARERVQALLTAGRS